MNCKLSTAGILAIISFLLLSASFSLNQDTTPWEAPIEYQNKPNPYTKVKDKERLGQYLYTKNCKFCHGNKGKGDGNQANLLKTKVADFTSEAFKAQTDGSIFYKISTGRNEMPGFKSIISEEEEIWMLINYVKEL